MGKKVEEATQSKETLAVKLEEPAEPQKQVVKKRARKFFTLRGKILGRGVEEPAQLKEEALVQKAEAPVQPQKEVVGEKEKPAPLQEEATVLEPVKGGMEKPSGQQPKKEEDAGEKREPALIKLDSQAVYTGEVELVIAPPTDLSLVSRLYNYLQTVPELRILYTQGSWGRGTTITVVLDKPLPLVKTLFETPGMEVNAGLLEKDDMAIGRPSLLSRGGERGTGRIHLVLKEAPATS